VENSDRWRQLANHIVNRRGELGYTQADVSAHGGPGISTMRSLEGALSASYRKQVLRRLERALDWQPGSVDAILDDGTPTPRPDTASPLRPVADDAIIRLVEASGLPPGDQRTILDELQRLRTRQDRERAAIVHTWLRLAGGAGDVA
jgi:hypothetical protein